MRRLLAILFCGLLVLVVRVDRLWAAPVLTGAQVLQESGFAVLRGVRYGLVTNATAMVGERHLLAVLTAAGVPPAVIFAPEHGLRGTFEDGVRVGDSAEQGIVVRSLYNGAKRPRPEDLAGLDLLVFDIQDVGVRFYTYLATMGLIMQGAAEAGVPLLVLDRPNPLGGDYVAGFLRDGIPASFTAFYPIPQAHGLTAGELAQLIRGERLLPGLEELELRIAPLAGWQRWMRWPDTGLPWVATSPNITNFDTALLYAGIGLLEGTGASEGRGTTTPFLLAGWPNLPAEALAASLNELELPGVSFAPARFTPRSLPGRASAPKFNGTEVSGVQIQVDDYRTVLPVETGVAVTAALYAAVPPAVRTRFFRRGLDDLAGTRQLRLDLEHGASAAAIAASWADEVDLFRELRRDYLLYGPDRERDGN